MLHRHGASLAPLTMSIWSDPTDLMEIGIPRGNSNSNWPPRLVRARMRDLGGRRDLGVP